MRSACLCTVLALTLLSACGKNEQPAAPKLFQPERSVLDQARKVDGIQQQQDDAQRKAIDQQTP